MGIRITKRAFPDCGEWTVWEPIGAMHPVIQRVMGTMYCRRAKLLFIVPLCGVGVFFTYGRQWAE